MATGFHGFHVLHRHHLPAGLPAAGDARRLHAEAAFRLRGRRLVLALRRRGLAVPVRLHLRLGSARRADRAWRLSACTADDRDGRASRGRSFFRRDPHDDARAWSRGCLTHARRPDRRLACLARFSASRGRRASTSSASTSPSGAWSCLSKGKVRAQLRDRARRQPGRPQAAAGRRAHAGGPLRARLAQPEQLLHEIAPHLLSERRRQGGGARQLASIPAA